MQTPETTLGDGLGPKQVIRLFVQTYESPNAQRNEELKACLAHNESMMEVIKVDRKDRITFREWFNIINEHANDNDLSILANSDIKFDETIHLAECIEHDECFSLTRYDNGVMHCTGADTWIFRGKIRDIEDCDFGLGIADCDYAIAERLNRAGYRLSNPSPEIKTHHVHESKFRTYYNMKKVPKPHVCHVPQLPLADRHTKMAIHTCFSKSHVGMFHRYLLPSIPDGVQINYREVPQHCQSAVYLESGWKDQMREKLQFMQEMQAGNELFVYLDVDVKIRSSFCLGSMLEELGDYDIAFQKDQNTVCAGVFIGRRNERTKRLFEQAMAVIDQYGCDQPAINACLKSSGVKWKFLSSKFWNFSHFAPFEWNGRLKFQIPPSALLVHANWCRGLELKTRMLEMA